MRRGTILLVIGGIMIGMLLFLAIFGPMFPFVDNELETKMYMHIDGKLNIAPFPPTEEYPLGTDARGRDLLSLLIIGTRETLLVVFFATLLRYLIAIPLAIGASNHSGPLYWTLNGWNSLFSGLPTLFAAIVLLNLPFILISDYRTVWFICIVAILEVGRVGYVFQQQAFALSKATFVESGQMIGNSRIGLYKRYYFPYLLPHMITNFVLDLGKVMLLIGQLGFFNLFISVMWLFHFETGTVMFQNTSNDWATLLADSRFYLRTEQHFWLPFYPAAMITFAIIAFNIFGEGLRQFFENKRSSRYNPKLEQKVMAEIEANKRQEKEIVMGRVFPS